jgi:hypothetical protein
MRLNGSSLWRGRASAHAATLIRAFVLKTARRRAPSTAAVQPTKDTSHEPCDVGRTPAKPAMSVGHELLEAPGSS